jgi:hypothetical protein
MARKCKDVEYMVHGPFYGPTGKQAEGGTKVGRTGHVSAGGDVYFTDGDEALALAARRAMSGRSQKLSVLVSSTCGARCYGGDDAVEQYREDPDASAFEEFEIKVDSHGRVR